MGNIENKNRAVSEVIGEMLMISLVLILAAVFTSQLPNYLPPARSPSVTILMSNDTVGNVTLWHKGGDWVKENTIKVVISNTFTRQSQTETSSSPNFIFVPDPAEPMSSVFDLGSNITIITGTPFVENTTITVATDRAVLFSGTLGGE